MIILSRRTNDLERVASPVPTRRRAFDPTYDQRIPRDEPDQLKGRVLEDFADMDAATPRQSTASGEADGRNVEQKKNLWTSMLESVASGKRLPEKNLLVLGTKLQPLSSDIGLTLFQEVHLSRNESS